MNRQTTSAAKPAKARATNQKPAKAGATNEEPAEAGAANASSGAVESRRLMLGTAGHIDHGKTTLLGTLTGVDCDRLPEEKHRGLTIDIGFARLGLGPFQLDIIDVPGHERLIRNMLAGAVGIDLALLVVAGDDSVMPQTREHLAILELLGVPRGVVVITKTDRVEVEWLELVEEEIRELVEGTFLQSAPVVRTAAAPDAPAQGLEALRSALLEVCRHVPEKPDPGIFRMPVDRAFSVAGRGAVVTGTVWSGELRAEDSVECLPRGQTLSVRGLQHHGCETDSVRLGQRAAINLSSVHHRELSRGQEIATPGYLAPARRMTVELMVLPDSPRGIRHRSRHRVYLGTQEVMARVELLEGTLIEPGQRGLAQIHCAGEAVAVCGQPLVIREQSPLVTIGGGRVLQPRAAPIRRRQRGRIERLAPLRSADETERAEAAVYFYGSRRWSELDLCRDAGLGRPACRRIIPELIKSGRVVEFAGNARHPHRVHRDVLEELQRRIVRVVEQFHERSPLTVAMPRSELAQTFQPRHEPRVVDFAIARLLADGILCGDNASVARSGRGPRLSESQQRLRTRLLAALFEAGFEPSGLRRLAQVTGAPEEDVRMLLRLAAEQGDLVHLGEELYLHRRTLESLKETLAQSWGDGSGFTVSQLRDRLGTSRKFAVPICEYLDRAGVTRRDGDLRRLCHDADGGAPRRS